MTEIGLFCNMNNNFFALGRYLRDYGEDVELLRFRSEHQHFHPSCDTLSNDYEAWTADLSWDKSPSLFKATQRDLRAVTDNYTHLVGCGAAPAFFHKSGRRADILLPYGGDLVDLPFRGANMKLSLKPRLLRKRLLESRFAHHQREGIREAHCVITELGFHGKQMARLGYHGQLIDHHLPIVYDYTDELLHAPEVRDSPFGRKVRELRDSTSFIVFHHARHIWKTYVDELSLKGNDALIRGFAKFSDQTKDRSAKLVVFDYGPDVEHSKRLIAELGIAEQVVWMPLSPRKCILYALLHADVATGQFRMPVNLNGVTQEALVCGKPLIHDRRDSRHPPEVAAGLYPIYDAATPEAIASALEELYADSQKREEMGRAGRLWYRETFVKRFLEHFLSALQKEARPHQAA